MAPEEKKAKSGPAVGIELAEEDIVAAMQRIPGYLDITPRDFQEVYILAYEQALERLSRGVSAAEIMTREVVSVRPETPLAQVAELMGERGVSGVPVVDGEEKLLGVISEKDFLRRLGVQENRNFMALVAACLRTKGCVAKPIREQAAVDIMSAPPVSVAPETRVRDIAELFSSRKINRAPVTDRAGRLLGIVTRGDLISATQRRS